MILFSPALIHTMKSYSHALCDFSDELTHSQRPHRMERKLRANITKVDRVSLIFLGTLIWFSLKFNQSSYYFSSMKRKQFGQANDGLSCLSVSWGMLCCLIIPTNSHEWTLFANEETRPSLRRNVMGFSHRSLSGPYTCIRRVYLPCSQFPHLLE